MELSQIDQAGQTALEKVVGYLNFSSGARDPQVAASLSELFGRLEGDGPQRDDTCPRLASLLGAKLGELAKTNSAFADSGQAAAALRLVFDHLLPAYVEHHRDLLFHQAPADLWRPFFLAEALAAVLRAGEPWDERDRIVAGALGQLNDFIGYRPVAVLRTRQKIEPYAHERVGPVPLYLRGAGVAAGRYRALVEEALAILSATDPELLDEAGFSLAQLETLAFDPRAFDFDHPVSKRPNYLFGQWDPHQIDSNGNYCRFVLQQITLDGLLDRVADCGSLSAEEALFEGAAVLAGVMLMSAGTTGGGPDAYDSSTTLGNLVPRIARYRDHFYIQLLERTGGPRGARLRREAKERREPFAGVRHHLNRYLAQQRAAQLEHVQLARLYARMGYLEPSRREARVVPVASARIACEIDGCLTSAHLAIDQGRPGDALERLPEIADWIHRGIECGALVDPWNILGFQGNFSLFPAVENSVHDHRVDELTEIIEQTFALAARLAGALAAGGDDAGGRELVRHLNALAEWWDDYPTRDIEGVHYVSGAETCRSARHVADSLAAWRRAGNAAGDIGFWRGHVEGFDSPKAYALVIEALLEHGDLVAAMALLMQWVSHAEDVPLEDGQFSLHQLAPRWMAAAIRRREPAEDAPPELSGWPLIATFLDRLEASAEALWHPPVFELAGQPFQAEADDDDEPLDEEGGIFDAAYEGMIYRDTTDDGLEGDVLDEGPAASDYELDHEARRLGQRLAMLQTAAVLWQMAAQDRACRRNGTQTDERAEVGDVLEAWLAQAQRNRAGLLRLLSDVEAFHIPRPGVSQVALLEYDRRRRVQHWLLERIIEVHGETTSAARLLAAQCAESTAMAADAGPWQRSTVDVTRAIMHNDAKAARRALPALLKALRKKQLLHRAMMRKGDPAETAEAGDAHRTLCDIAGELPRLGLYVETGQLLLAAQAAERDNPLGPGAVTQFDRLFQVAYQALVEALVHSSRTWKWRRGGPTVEAQLSDCIESLTDALLPHWLEHSRSVRISVLEPLASASRWQKTKRFIERYGGDLFTQEFFNPGNLRAILDHGGEAYLRLLDETDELDPRPRLLDELDHRIPRAEAAGRLMLICEAILENFSEYNDYNATTTQSDRGELLYILLDFLRLAAAYDRVAWNLQPVTLAHEVLVRHNCLEAAELWRHTLAVRTQEPADRFQHEYEALCAKYGVRLATVGDHVGERFVRPLALDRIRALVEPAIRGARQGEGGATEAFEQLDQEIREFSRHPTGAGLDVPEWLMTLDEEVEELTAQRAVAGSNSEGDDGGPWERLSLATVRRKLEAMQRDQ